MFPWLVLSALLTLVLSTGAESRDTQRDAAGERTSGASAVQRAAALVQQGKLDEAAAQARVALGDPATRAVAHSVLGVISFQQKQFNESAKHLEEAIRLEPKLLGAHLSLAQVYTIQEKPQRALALYRRILGLDPGNASARQALAQFKQSPGGLIILATNHVQAGERTEAAALVADWMRLADAPEPLAIKFGLLLAEAKLADEAIAILEKARESGAASYELEFNLGSAYLLKGNVRNALERYDAALAVKPDSLVALEQAAHVAESNGELERSLSYRLRAKKIQPENAEVLLGFGRVCLKMDLLDDAETAVTKAASLKPGDPAYQYILAAAKVGKKQYEAAQAILEAMVKRKPDDPQFQYALGAVLYVQGRLDEAADRFRESVRLQPDQLASQYHLALVARDQGREAEATETLKKLLAQHPDHAPSSEVLGGLLMNAQRYTEAEPHLRRAVSLNPASVKANYQLGLLLARMGRKEESDKQLALTKTLREEDERTSRLQLRLLDPDQ